MIQQSELIKEKNWDWLIICDGGRADIFHNIYEEYFDVSYNNVVDNGGHTYTVSWFQDHFSEENELTLYHAGVPLHSFKNNPHNYDERDYFKNVISWDRYEWDDRISTAPPESVINVLKRNSADTGVIRFLQPHNPYRTLTEVNDVNDAKYCSYNTLREAYIDNYEWVLGDIEDKLLDIIDGTIAIASDHGQCFGECGQHLHGPNHSEHDHLTEVPWVVLD